MIPRIIHQIWLGDPMPDHLAIYCTTWAEHHPGWEHRLWTDGDFGWLRNQRLFDTAQRHTPHVGQFRADIARYEILHRFGGVYVDCDFECRRPIDDLLDADSFAAWEEDDVWVNNAILGAVPAHPLMADLIARLPASVARHRGKRPNVMTGPQFLTQRARRHHITVHPARLFYPYSWSELDRQGEDFPDVYAIHHWDNARRRAAARA